MLYNLNSYAFFNLPQPHLHWVKKKNMLNHDILSQSFNTNTSRWEPNVHLRGKLIIITAFCDPFSNNKYCICFIIYKLYHCTIYLIIDYEATVTFGTD